MKQQKVFRPLPPQNVYVAASIFDGEPPKRLAKQELSLKD
jgi:hypothetical protein